MVVYMTGPAITGARLLALLGGETGPLGYRDLADGIRMLVMDGRVPAGSRLPSERDLTAALPVSRTTVSRAYVELRQAGYLSSRAGTRSVVRLPDSAVASRVLAPGEGPSDALRWTIAAGSAAPGVGLAFHRALEALPAYLAGTGYLMAGLPVLRERIADRYSERGLPTDPGQVVVTSGAQAAFALLIRSLLDGGDRILLESPTYPNAIEAVRRSGLRTVGLPLDEGGWHPATLEATLRQTAPRLAYLLPDFQNPTGHLMPASARERIGPLLERHRTQVVVDETMAELALDLDEADLPAPMAAFARDAITIGSASKTFWGGLRIGWIRAPHEVVNRLLAARRSLDLGAAVLEQLVVAELLADRNAVVTERRTELRGRRDQLVALLADRFPDWRASPPPGGLSLWVELPERISSRIAVAAEQHGLIVTAGPRFFVDAGGERHLRLPFSRASDDLEEAVSRLAQAYEHVVTMSAGVRAGADVPLTA
ncbi:MAG: PLP-dependent aminotransferase family protein [Nocardioidaceae bacterium]